MKMKNFFFKLIKFLQGSAYRRNGPRSYYGGNQQYYSKPNNMDPYYGYDNRYSMQNKYYSGSKIRSRPGGKLSRTNSAVLTKRRSSSKLSPKKSLEK